MAHYVTIHEAAHAVGWLGPFSSKAAAEAQKRELAATLGHGYSARCTTKHPKAGAGGHAKKNPRGQHIRRTVEAATEGFDDALGGHAGIRAAHTASRLAEKLAAQGRYEEAAEVLGRAGGKHITGGAVKAARVGAALTSGGASELVMRMNRRR